MLLDVRLRMLIGLTLPDALENGLSEARPRGNEAVELVVISNRPRTKEDEGDGGRHCHPREATFPAASGCGHQCKREWQ